MFSWEEKRETYRREWDKAEHNASELNRVTDNEIYKLNTFRLNNSEFDL